LLPWEDSISIPSLGSIARLIGFVVAGLWLGTIVLEGKFRKPDAFHVLILLFFLWNFLSVFWSSDVESTIQRIKTYSQTFLLLLIYWDLFQKPEDLNGGLQAYVLGAYVLILSTIYNYLAGNIAVQYEERYSATRVNANDVALILILGLPFALQLFFAASRNPKGTVQQVINLFFIPLSIFSIVLTGSRTSLIAIIPFGIFMTGTQQIKVERKILIFLILLVSLLLLLPFIPQSVINRLATIGESISNGDLGGRGNLWREGIAVLVEHPFLGIGAGAMDYAIGSAVHNTFLSVATETGLIGFVLFLSGLGLIVYRATMLSRGVSSMWLTIFVTWAIGVFTLSWEYRKITWIMLSFMIIESSLQKQISEQDGNINFAGGIRRSFEEGKSVNQSKGTS
jgi:O-antigen ligase